MEHCITEKSDNIEAIAHKRRDVFLCIYLFEKQQYTLMLDLITTIAPHAFVGAKT